MRKFEEFTDMAARTFPELHKKEGALTRTVTFQVTDACNLACTYCYQINKGTRRMSLETAKKFIDYLLDADETNEYINPIISPFIILDFIGGEPLLEIELIDKIMDYFVEQAFLREHPWATRYVISLCSNGTLYFKPEVKKFFNKHRQHLSFNVTIDGNKELHDSCRIFPDGSPSYDMALAAAQDWISTGGYMGSKITICPENLPYLNQALRHFVSLGYEEINANCVYEEGWTLETATELYNQMKDFSNYMIDENLDIFCSLYSDEMFRPKKEEDLQNWCGGTGSMLAMDPDGGLYPCIRYMESSLGDDQPPIKIGHITHGLQGTEEEKQWVKCLNCINRRTQSTDKCFYCPIAEGCAWCSAFNYQETGTPDKRVTYICEMHKARALANCYHWNKYYQANGIDKKMKLYVPRKWAEPIIGKEEYEMLLELSGSEEVFYDYKEEE